MGRSKGASPDHPAVWFNYTELTILLILNSSSGVNIKELANQLGIERSWVSRIISSLAKDGLLTTHPSAQDRRSSEFTVLNTGQTTLREAIAFDSEIMTQSIAHLAPGERKRLLSYVSELADGAGVPKYPKYEGAHPLFIELLRLTRFAKLHSDDYLETGFTLTQLRILHALEKYEPNGTSISRIADELPHEISGVSRAVAALEKDEIVERRTSELDRRSFFICLTSTGHKALLEYSNAAAELFRSTLEKFSTKAESDFLEILDKANAPELDFSVTSQDNQLTLRKLSRNSVSDEELDALGVSHCRFAERETERFGIYVDNSLRGIALLRRKHGGQMLKHLSIEACELEISEFQQLFECLLQASSTC